MKLNVEWKKSPIGRDGFKAFALYVNGSFYGRLLQSISPKVQSMFMLEAWPGYKMYSPFYFHYDYDVALNDLQLKVVSDLVKWKPEWFE